MQRCFLFQGKGPHNAHQERFSLLDIEYRQFETGGFPGDSISKVKKSTLPREYYRIKTGLSLSSNYDVIVCGGTLPLETAFVYKMLKNPKVKIIYLVADSAFLIYEPVRWKIMGKGLGKIISGCISDSNHVFSSVSPIVGNVPNEIVNPPIPKEHYSQLYNANISSPNDSYTLLSVGRADLEKNHQLLVSAAEKLNSEVDKCVNVILVGKGHNKMGYSNSSIVSTPGFVSESELVNLHQNASIYVQPSLEESFGIAPVEGMLSGTPTIVSQGVGMKEYLPQSHVFENSAESLKRSMKRILEKGEEEKYNIGKEHRDTARKFTVERQSQKCKRAMEKLIGCTN